MGGGTAWKRNFKGGWKPQGGRYVTRALGREALEDAEKSGYDSGFDDGYADGRRDGSFESLRCCYAAICIVLHDKYGFGKNRCFDVLKDLDEKVIWALNHRDLAQEVLDKTGLEIEFDEAFDRLHRKDRRINGK